MDLNHIFLFIAIASPLVVLAYTWRTGRTRRGWRVAAVIVLAITCIAWFVAPKSAGFVGGGAWFVLLFVPAIGLRKASQLAARGRYESARRLATVLQFLHPTAQLRDQVRMFHTLAVRHGAAADVPSEPGSQDRHPRLRGAPAVIAFILLNVAVFCIELWRGALANPVTLHRLGSLDFFAVIQKGEFWRLISALFLHFSFLHLGFNLFALYVLGPPLEKILGPIRFAICYLISGIGSTAGVVLLTLLNIVRPAELVGASGSIMGIVGAWAGFLFRHRQMWQAKQRLLNILLIIAIQIAFDISTPEVSTSAHLCGLVVGFFLGLMMRPRRVSL